ncbi:uncharacterized protein N7529_006571 [Penicillium soppii]|jgi:hypothetical protein|uniref:uncharacterized protein n=1 Tax=Penicillium soppii TaxID=69789 RepID=UPI002547510C|nr:uncharacterized protein N7529_006571 [Penicillium soppii]KAJ5864655.1 hypothetical protein N7529_006571 [Penicillium soppii]
MGDLLQIAEQEFHIGILGLDIHNPSGYVTGVRLSGPEEEIETSPKRLHLIVDVESDAQELSLRWKDEKLGAVYCTDYEDHTFLRAAAVENNNTNIFGALKKSTWAFPSIVTGVLST